MVGANLTFKYVLFAIGLVGLGGGICIGFFLTTTIMVGNVAAYYLILVGASTICMGFAYYKKDIAMILNTTFIGSYLFVRGISFYVGGFPNETDIVLIIHNNILTKHDYNKIFYFYLLSILLLFSASFSWKFYKYRKT